MSETRKLAAILAVDVVGYSRLMGEDEAGRRGECANVPTWRVLCELLMPPSRTAAFPSTPAVSFAEIAIVAGRFGERVNPRPTFDFEKGCGVGGDALDATGGWSAVLSVGVSGAGG